MEVRGNVGRLESERWELFLGAACDWDWNVVIGQYVCRGRNSWNCNHENVKMLSLWSDCVENICLRLLVAVELSIVDTNAGGSRFK